MMKVSNFKEIKKSENEEGANFINKNYKKIKNFLFNYNL